MTAYEQGRMAFLTGVNYGGNPHPPSAESRAWNLGWKYESELAAKRNKVTEADQRLRNVVAAIEALIDAKIRYALACHTPARTLIDISETREHLSDKIAELIAGNS